MRFAFITPGFDSGPVELHKALVDIQMTLTSLERLLSDTMRAKGIFDRKETHLKMVWQEAFDKALAKANSKPSFGDFTTGKEKTSDANLAVFHETRALRNMQESASFAAEAADVVRLHYYGLDKVRQDIRKRLDMSQTDYYS